MAYHFTSEKVSHVQEETTYILYMIIGSYYHKCICTHRLAEKKLLLYYKDLPATKQEKAEEKIISSIEYLFREKHLLLSDLNCEAGIKRSGECYLLRFYTGIQDLYVRVYPDGLYIITDSDEYEWRSVPRSAG